MSAKETNAKSVKWEDRTVPSRPLAIIAGILACMCCLCCGPLALTLGPSELLAKVLVPPPYPGSIQVGRWRSGGLDSMWEESTYHTTDSIEKVLAFYEARMPGFEQFDDSTLGNLYYVNGRSDNGPLGILASWGVDDPIRPGVSVAIYKSSDDRTITVIHMRVEWPAQ